MMNKILGYMQMAAIMGMGVGGFGWCLYVAGWEAFKMFVFVLILGVFTFSCIGFAFHCCSGGK